MEHHILEFRVFEMSMPEPIPAWQIKLNIAIEHLIPGLNWTIPEIRPGIPAVRPHTEYCYRNTGQIIKDQPLQDVSPE